MQDCFPSELLQSYLEELLSEAESSSVAAHLETCDRCILELQRLVKRNEPLSPGFMNAAQSSEFGDSLPEIPGYEVKECLGRGGMGIVYSAIDVDSQQKVAIKLVNRRYDAALNQRFRREGRLLASVEHPNIARLYRVGTFQNSPYFVMELVEGEDLLAACTQSLSLRERLGLFLQVCDATQLLHRMLIIHRDLKPSNILVSSIGGIQTPKLIDFGLAKLLEHDETEFTQTNSMLGTLAYMSPEQAAGNNEMLDASTDIYSLGVVLYELLVGDTPISRYRLRSLTKDEARKVIQNEDPRPPSSQNLAPVDNDDDRKDFQPIHANQLVGDIDAIVLQALRKEPANRYQSVGDFAADIRRYLNSDPVKAAAPPTFYRAQKFVKKNAAVVAFTSALVLTLAAGVLSTSYWLREARAATKVANETAIRESEAKDVANEMRAKETAARIKAEEATAAAQLRRKKMQKASLLLRGFFNGLNPEILDAGDGQLRGILVSRLKESAEEMLAEDLSEDEDVLLLRESLANTLVALGQQEAALPLWEAITTDIVALKGENSLDGMTGFLLLGQNYTRNSRYEDAENQNKKARQIADQLFEATDPNSIIVDHYRATNLELMGKLDQSYEIRLPLLGRLGKPTTETQHLYNDLCNSIGVLQMKLGRNEEAVLSLENAVEGMHKVFPSHHPLTLKMRSNVALAKSNLGDIEGAESEYREILRLKSRQYPADSAPVAQSKIDLAARLIKSRKTEEGVKLLEDVVSTSSSIEFQLNAKVELAVTEIRLFERKDEGVSQLEQLLEEISLKLGPQHRVFKLCEMNLKRFSGSEKNKQEN